MNDNIMRAAGFGEQVDLKAEGKCPFCKKEVLLSDFQDALSVKEWKISGLCQECQDEVFRGGE